MRRSYTALAAIKPRVSSINPTPYSWVNESVQSNKDGRFGGRSVAIKDNISYTLAPTSCSSQILDGYHPPYDATCVSSLQRHGAQIVGQTKMDEFGMGSQTSHLPPNYTPVHNPAASEEARSAGGSSGGSAAAVAEGSCWAALGTDTGGSVRLPASYCGVVGLKPSYGMISRYGVVSYADSLDCVGVLGRTIDTVQQVFDSISHPDSKDMTCINQDARDEANRISAQSLDMTTGPSSKPLEGLRIGIPTQTHLPSPSIQIPEPLLVHLKSLGASLQAVDLPSFNYALPAYYVLASAEASSNLARYGGGWFGSRAEKELVWDEGESGEDRRRRIRTEGFGQEVKKRILAGTHALSANEFNNTYLKALHLRHLLRDELSRTFRIENVLSASKARSEGIDLLLHPTAVQTAPLLSATKGKSEYQQDLLTVPASLAGLPAMSVPAGLSDGLPIGMSLMGQWGMESLVFAVGKHIETWSQRND